MHVITSLSEIKKQTAQLRSAGKTIGFVPTMGALHAGHLQLLQTAAGQNHITVCSIFVNPTQFNNAEDYRLYPRTLDEDARVLEAEQCDILFAPTAAEMYPEAAQLKFDFGPLEQVMEGKYRPGHFNGVATVVSKLFHLVNPHRAYFGQKDLQQYTILNQMVQDLNFNLELVCHPIIREADGLAMSSRNRRLTAEQRAIAVHLYKALNLASELLKTETIPQVKETVAGYLSQFNQIQLEYLEIVDVKTLQPLTQLNKQAGTALCIAAYLGDIRLIDNVILT